MKGTTIIINRKVGFRNTIMKTFDNIYFWAYVKLKLILTLSDLLHIICIK